MIRAGYIQHAEDGDFTQPGTMVREVLDDAQRDRLVANIVGHVLNGVTEPILLRVFEYWRHVDKDLGDRVEAGVREAQAESAEPSEDATPTP
jgi:catalase